MILGIAQCKENKNIEIVKYRPTAQGNVVDFWVGGSFAQNAYNNYIDYRIREAKYILDASLEFVYE